MTEPTTPELAALEALTRERDTLRQALLAAELYIDSQIGIKTPAEYRAVKDVIAAALGAVEEHT